MQASECLAEHTWMYWVMMVIGDDDDDDDIQQGWPVGLIDIDDALRRAEPPRPPQATLAHPTASCALCQTPVSRDGGDQDGDDIDAKSIEFNVLCSVLS